MHFKNIRTSIKRIMRNRNINRPCSLLKYCIWQFRKALNYFPCELKVSNSTVIVKNRVVANGVGGLINCQGLYDYNNMNLVRLLLSRGIVNSFIDIGANIGIYSIIASEIADSVVYAFEPHPFTFTLLKENIERNNRNNVFLYNKAVGDVNCIVEFTDVPGSSTNRIVHGENGNSVIRVESITLKKFCADNGVTPEMVKIDTEGFEYYVIKGFQDILSEVKLLLVEMHERDDQVRTMMRQNRFDGPYFFDFNKATFHRTQTSKEDAIFIAEAFKNDLLLCLRHCN